jgi:N-acetylglucosamine transport system substrate-binding protein
VIVWFYDNVVIQNSYRRISMRKITGLVLALLLLSAMFTFATGGRQQSTTASGANVLNIAVFEGGFGRAYWDDIVAQFQRANPGVTVNLSIDPEIGNILSPRIAVGDWPDLINLADNERSGVVATMVQNRELLDITDVFNGQTLDRPGTRLRDIIIPGMLESVKYSPYGDGRIYMAPFSVGPMGMVYNRTLFQQKGWRLPRTWDEFFALDQELQKPENYVNIGGRMEKRSLFTYQGIYAGYLESVFWPAIAGAGGLNAINDITSYRDGSFRRQEVRDVVSMFARLGTQGYLMEGTVALNHTQSQTDMMLGRALFIPNGTWMENEMADSPRESGFEFGLMPPPTLRAGQDQYVLSSYDQIQIPRQAKNPELAKQFLRFLYTRDSIISFARNANGTIAVTDAREIGRNYLSSGVYGMFSAYDTGKFMLMNFETLPQGSRVNVSAVVFDDNMGPLVTGRLTPDAYISRVEDAFAQIRADRR